MKCPTVKVTCDNEQGFYVINESDFDKNEHELFSECKEPKEPKEGTINWYKSKLDAMSIEYSDTDKKPDLKELFDAASDQ